VSPKQRFNLSVEPAQLAVLQAIQERTGATPSEQIRRAIQMYLGSQTVLTKAEMKKLLGETTAKK
jgi:hypothetical protein